MTGTGDGMNLDFLNEPDPVTEKPQAPAEPVESEVPSPLSLPDGLELNDEGDPSSSIFDDGPSGPVNSLNELPDAVPNISDGGTEILARGRSELQEFEEQFGGGTAPPGELSSAVPEFTDLPEPVTGVTPAPVEPESLLDGLFEAATDATEGSIPPTVADMVAPGMDTSVGLPQPALETPPSLDLSGTSPVETGSGLNLDLSPPEVAPASSEPPSPLMDLGDALAVGTAATAVASAALDDLPSVSSAVTTSAAKPGAATDAGNQRLILIAVGGYAVLVTLLCLFLLVMLSKARRAGQLESLPELQPLPRDRVALYPVQLDIPATHVLKIGESRRFGHLKVEPVRVTRGPAEMIHYSGDRSRGGYKTAPVLKLWFRFTNESKDQTFAPIDHDLVFLRNDSGNRANNNFLVEQSRKRAGGPTVLTFDHTDSNHDFAGQNLGKMLGPGESIEAYYPTTEDDFEKLSGDLIWRVQLRKGLGPSGHGVTTLVEVAFATSDIRAEGT